jgi:Bacterial regulatory helix-turn-helix protein, lysR family
MLARSCDRVQRCFPMRAVGLIEPEDAGKMELPRLTSFRAVAKALSFTRAAAQLGYAQVRVTDQAKTLERRAYRDR